MPRRSQNTIPRISGARLHMWRSQRSPTRSSCRGSAPSRHSSRPHADARAGVSCAGCRVTRVSASQRIALVRQRYNPFGGAERFIERALASLERLGAEVTLIAREWRDAGARRFLRVNPPYIGALWRDAGFARAARAAWTRERFDLVQSHERIPGCDVYRAGDGVHRQWLEYRLQEASRLERSKVRANPYHRYVCKVERNLFEHARLRAVICNSQMVRADVLRHFRVAEAKLHVVHNGVDLVHFHPRHR